LLVVGLFLKLHQLKMLVGSVSREMSNMRHSGKGKLGSGQICCFCEVLKMLRGQLVAAFRAGVRDSVPAVSSTVEAVSTLSEEVSVL
jgi:hypothetical protein